MTDRSFLVEGSEQASPRKKLDLKLASDVYEADICRWALEQAEHIRAGRFDMVDRVNTADEIEDVGKRHEEALISNLEVVLAHMLKWSAQPQRRGRSWEQTIAEHRERVDFRFAKAPTLRAKREERLGWAYKFARRRASRETRLPVSTFPATCPYDWDAIMTRPFVLDQTDETA